MHQVGIISEILDFKRDKQGFITLLTVTDGYKVTLIRPKVKTSRLSQVIKAVKGTNFLDY